MPISPTIPGSNLTMENKISDNFSREFVNPQTLRELFSRLEKGGIEFEDPLISLNGFLKRLTRIPIVTIGQLEQIIARQKDRVSLVKDLLFRKWGRIGVHGTPSMYVQIALDLDRQEPLSTMSYWRDREFLEIWSNDDVPT